MPLIGALALAAALTACGRNDDDARTAGQQVDDAVAQTREAGREMRADATVAAGDAARRLESAASGTAEALSDAAIVTKVNAALMADDQLKATQIDVRAEDGRVTLTGMAPDASSLARAGSLVQAIDGVRSVDNQLTVARHG
jgi:osmotically-inducible protein OsmY